MEAATLSIAIAGVILQAVFIVIVFRSLRVAQRSLDQTRVSSEGIERSARLNAFLQLKDLTIASNRIVMHSDKNMKAAEEMMYGKDQSELDPRKRWIAFGFLNAAEASWQANQLAEFDDYARAMLDHHLRRLLVSWVDKKTNERIEPLEVWNALYYGGYDKDFIEYCKDHVSTDFKAWVEQQAGLGVS